MGRILPVPAQRRARSWLAASLAAAVVALGIAAPALAARGPVRLADPSISPTQVTAGKTVTFSVTYSNGQGNGPTSIVVKVGSATYALSAPSGSTNYGGGVVYSVKVTPPAGSWAVTFIATDKFGNTASLAAGTLTVLAPPPPSGGGSGGSGSGSGSSGGSSSGGSSSGGSGGSSGSSGSSAGASGSGSAASGSTASGSSGTGATGSGATSQASTVSTAGNGDATAGTAGDGLPPWQVGRRGWWTASFGSSTTGPGDQQAASGGTAVGSAAPPGAIDVFPDESSYSLDDGRWSSGGSGPGGASTSLDASLPGLGGGVPLGQLMTTAVVTLGGVAMAMSFMLFGRRRRDDDPTDTDEALAEAAASGAGLVASGSLLGGLGGRPAPMTVPRDAELDLPRWRRPSLLAARKEDPLRMERTEVKLTFDHGAVAPVEGHERRVIRYRLVRLLDSPDELIAGELGSLDEGDEVQLLQRSGAYWLVLCPDGRQGWVHRMVLGDVVDDTGEDAGGGPARRSPDGRSDGEFQGRAAGIRLSSAGPAAWSLQGVAATDAGMDVDDDVLRAYLAARGRH